MHRPHRLTGVPASAGYAEGPLFDLDGQIRAYTGSGDPQKERAALDEAIAATVASLAELAGALGDDAAEILEFQIAMLEDDALVGPAQAAIAEGLPADAAWRQALDAEIAGYEAAEQDYFRARAADLRDMRDQVLAVLAGGGASGSPAGAILFGDDIGPTRFLETDWSRGGGIALKAGSAASHVAMLARARGVPMVVGLGDAAGIVAGLALLDAEHGGIVLSPDEEERAAFRARSTAFRAERDRVGTFLSRPARTRRDTEVRVNVNVADPSDVDHIDIATCDGVGLMRTEFLFGGATGLPDEETQYAAYAKVLDWACGKPVTIRTVDAGGDKPVPGFTLAESNPFLGLRGIRLSLARPDVFRVQARALLRAAVRGTLKVMFPMIAVPDEYRRACALFEAEAGRLAGEGIAHRMPPLGIMVEVPSTAVTPDLFADAAFFSIGSNDLTQYVMAAARDNGALASLASVRHPAVLRLIEGVARYGAERGIPVSLCGDAGGDPTTIPALIEAGLRELSVAPAQLGAAKAAIAEVAV